MRNRIHDCTCQVCEASFKGYHATDLYCSSKCRNNNDTKKETTKKFRLKRREMLNQIKMEAGCCDCGYNEHPAALHFDHVLGVKNFNISMDPKRKWQDILEEIAKCEIVCANCHSIRTHERNQYYENRNLRSGH
jgi:hypothetical protein